MNGLTVKALGKPEVWLGERAVKFATQKALALFIYLALEKGQHSRVKLINLLWPESDSAHGQPSLRNTLARLRSALADSGEEYVQADDDWLAYNPRANVEFDFEALQAALEGKPDAAKLLVAEALYRGEFLEGLALPDAPEFEEWLAQQRAYWHGQYSRLLESLATRQSETGNTAGRLVTARRWVAHDPLDEAAHQQLLQAYVGLGDKAAALKAFEDWQALLVKELKAQPAPETLALAETIRQMPMAPTGRKHSRQLDLPFVGRAAQHLQLVMAYQNAGEGRGQVVVVDGEAGIGKSRLVREFLTWSQGQGADIIRGQAFEAYGRLPYQPIVQALRQRLEQENAPDDLLTDSWLAELSRLLPELRDRYPDLPPPMGDESLGRTRLLEAIAQLTQALSERRPLVMFIDDLHWADAASLDVLQYLIRAWAESNARVLAVLSVRAEAVATTPHLRDWLAALGRNADLVRLPLGPISLDDTQSLVQTLTESTGEAAVAAWLYKETGGQPFYLSETIKVITDQGGLKAMGTHEVAAAQWRGLVPPGIREVILARLNRLSPPALQLLNGAVVAGRASDFDLLIHIADLAEREGLAALDELLASRVVVEANVASGLYTVAHDKIRDVTYTEAGEARRRQYHRRALDYLETHAALEAELAHHAQAARLLEPAFRYFVAAGESAMRLFAVRGAIEFYTAALHLLSETPITPDETGRLYLALGRAYELNNDYQPAKVIYETLLTLARAHHQPGLENSALNRLATLMAQRFNNVELATTLLHEALAVAEKNQDKVALADTEWNLAQLSYYLNEAKPTLVHAGQALALSRSLGNEDLIARSLNILAYAHMMLGEWEQTDSEASEARTYYAAQLNRAMEVDCLCLMARGRTYSGRPQEGTQAGREAQKISREIENIWGQVNSVNSLSPGLLDIGDYEEALKQSEWAVNTARQLGFNLMIIYSLTRYGTVQRTLFQAEAAQQSHQEALALAQSLLGTKSIAFLVEWITAELCADYALAGNWETAVEYARQSLALRDYSSLYGGLTRWYETQALIRAGELEQAEADLERFEKQVGSNRRYQIPYLKGLAALAMVKNDPVKAKAKWNEALDLAQAIGLPGEEWQLLQLLGDEARASRVFQTLVGKIEDEETRATFLGARQALPLLGQ